MQHILSVLVLLQCLTLTIGTLSIYIRLSSVSFYELPCSMFSPFFILTASPVTSPVSFCLATSVSFRFTTFDSPHAFIFSHLYYSIPFVILYLLCLLSIRDYPHLDVLLPLFHFSSPQSRIEICAESFRFVHFRHRRRKSRTTTTTTKGEMMTSRKCRKSRDKMAFVL